MGPMGACTIIPFTSGYTVQVGWLHDVGGGAMKSRYFPSLERSVAGFGRRAGWTMFVLFAVLTLTVVPLKGVFAQDAQPTTDPAQVENNDPLAPQGGSTPEATSEPTQEPTSAPTQEAKPTKEPATSNESSSNQGPTVQKNDQAVSPGFPAVLTSGLAYQGGGDVVWQVREIDVPAADDAKSTTSEEAVLYQVEGTTIVRNDKTGKRALLQPGDAYFRTSDDSYTIATEDKTSVLWQFELVSKDNVELDAIYESPTLGDIDEGVYDMELVRYVLQPGDTADLPKNSGAGLVLVANGQAVVEAGDTSNGLKAGQGKSFAGSGTVSNNGDSPAIVLYAYLGEEVGDTIAGSGTSDSTDSSSSSTSEDTSSDGTSGTSETSSDTSETSSDTSSESSDSSTLQEEANPSTDTQEAAPAEPDENGAYVTSVNVTAGSVDLYIVMTVDGTVVFDGPLPAGASTGPVVGSVFDVYTSSGVNTSFTNACGETFMMGSEEGEVTYTLTADANSCAP